MSFFEFPHTRTYDSDLGWLIKHFRLMSDTVETLESWASTHKEEYDELKDKVDGLINNLVDVISPWDSSIAYHIFSIVEYQGINYIAVQDVPVGAMITNTDYWQPANTVVEQINAIGTVVNEIKDRIVMPEDFGAVGDGVTDDSQAWQDMFDSAPYFVECDPAHNYLINTAVNINNECVVHGNGCTITTESVNTQRARVFNIYAPCDFSNINAVSTADKALINESDNVGNSLSSNKILFYLYTGNCKFDNINAAGIHTVVLCNDGATITQHDNLYISNIKATNTTFGIHLNRCKNVYIENCDIEIQNTSNDICHALYIVRYVENCTVHGFHGKYAGNANAYPLAIHASSESGVGKINKNLFFSDCFFEVDQTNSPTTASIMDSSACDGVYFDNCKFYADNARCGLTVVLGNPATNVIYNNCFIHCGGYASGGNGMILGRFVEDTDFMVTGCTIEMVTEAASCIHKYGNAKYRNCHIVQVGDDTNLLQLWVKGSAFPYSWEIVFDDCMIEGNMVQLGQIYDGTLANVVRVIFMNCSAKTVTHRGNPFALSTNVLTDVLIDIMGCNAINYTSWAATRNDVRQTGNNVFTT